MIDVVNKQSQRQPIVSVIIPTAGDRDQLLDRAVFSALSGWQSWEVEILIVLNRQTELYPDLKLKYQAYANVVILVSEKVGVSIARNVGLTHASGRLIRFLDDDDFLYESIAVYQCRELLQLDSMLSSYALELVNENGKSIGVRSPVDNPDVYVALASHKRLQIPLSFVYRRSFIIDHRWEESLSLAEDTVWLLGILSLAECSWIRSDKVVGVWYQHSQSRLSRRFSSSQSALSVARSLCKLAELELTSSSDRKSAIADGLWSCIVAGFRFRPLHWSRISRKATTLDKNSCPDSIIYRFFYHLGFSPLLVNWILLPFFWLQLGFRCLISRVRNTMSDITRVSLANY